MIISKLGNATAGQIFMSLLSGLLRNIRGQKLELAPMLLRKSYGRRKRKRTREEVNYITKKGDRK
jgi:hypothetical protein